MRKITVLAVGDVVGNESVKYVQKHLSGIKKEYNVDFTVLNCENSADSNGVEIQGAEALFSAGADVLTSGNHIWKRHQIQDYLDDNKNILRPANYPPEAPGMGHTICEVNGIRILVMNLLGTVYLDPLACPFMTAEKILSRENGRYDLSILDFHAEATSEKLAMAYEFDGRINVIFGTHTHVQTADERIMPKGTGYITDIGMTGPDNSVLGVCPELIIKKLKTHMPVKFELAKGDFSLCGAVFEIDADSKRVISVQRIKK